MRSSAEFNSLDEMERAVAQFRSAGVPGDTVPALSGKRGGGPYTLMFDFTPPQPGAGSGVTEPPSA